MVMVSKRSFGLVVMTIGSMEIKSSSETPVTAADVDTVISPFDFYARMLFHLVW